MNRWVLDSSAVLAWINQEDGAAVVAEHIDDGIICSVNLAEIVSRLSDLGNPTDQALELMAGFLVAPADRALSFTAGALRRETRDRGLSLGDRFCLALAQRENLPVLTAHRAWADLDLGVQVVLIR